jgi:predicted small secreted protein
MLYRSRMSSKIRRWAGACAFMGMLVLAGCRNTAHGIKEDTKAAVRKTGEGIERAGQSLQNTGKDDKEQKK